MKRLILIIGLLALPAVASAQQAETIEYYGTDAIGSIRIVWDASGNVIARQDFTPFGEPVLQQGTAIPKEGFGGNESDAETNQDYFHARMFEARSGRFTRTDSIEDGVAEPQRWNRYAYGLNNPLSFTDAGGLNADPCAGTDYQTASCVTAPFINPDWSFGGDWTDMFSAESGGWAAGLSSDQDGRQRGGGATTTTTTTTTSTPTPGDPPGNPPCDPSKDPMCKTPCPAAPPNVSVSLHVATARGLGTMLDAIDPAIGLGLKVGIAYFAFRNHSPMDYKNRFSRSYENFGNFNYGATATALGLPSAVVQRAAGLAQTLAGTSKPEWGTPTGPSPYGDDPKDQEMIRLGIEFATRGAAVCNK